MVKGRILMIDDSAAMRLVMRTPLMADGFEVTEASSAEEAMERLDMASDPFTLIITEQNMRGMSGAAMVKKIYQHKNLIHPKTPVIMLTADGSADLLSEMRSLKIAGLVLKPVNPHQFLRIVQKLHENYQRNSEVNPQPNPPHPNPQKIRA